MPSSITVSCRLVDICLPDYVPDHRWIGVSLSGQTREEMAKQAAEEFYEFGYDSEEYPIGDYAFNAIKEAALGAIKPGVRFWPCDASGNEITDPDAEVPDEQPSAWFVFDVEVTPLAIKLTNSDDDDGSVLVTCEDRGAAADDGYIDGSTWECPSDMTEAYTVLCDRPTLVQELESEGYDVDASEYSPPSDEDMARWSAKCGE